MIKRASVDCPLFGTNWFLQCKQRLSGSSAGFSLTVNCLNRARILMREHQFCFARCWQMIKNILFAPMSPIWPYGQRNLSSCIQNPIFSKHKENCLNVHWTDVNWKKDANENRGYLDQQRLKNTKTFWIEKKTIADGRSHVKNSRLLVFIIKVSRTGNLRDPCISHFSHVWQPSGWKEVLWPINYCFSWKKYSLLESFVAPKL